MTVQDMDIPNPSQHTMSGNHRPVSEMPFKCFRCCIAKKKERKAGEGGGEGGGGGLATNLRAPLKPIQFFWCFLHVLLLFFLRFVGGGVNC